MFSNEPCHKQKEKKTLYGIRYINISGRRSHLESGNRQGEAQLLILLVVLA